MKFIIFTHNYPTSISERRNAGIFVHDFACELAKTNSVSVVCPGSFNKKTKFDGVTVYFFSWGNGKHLGKLRFWNPLDLSNGLNLIRQGFNTLRVAVKETKPDFALVMWAIPGGFFAYIAKVIYGIPYAIWVLGSDFYVYSKIPILGFFISSVLKSAKYTFADGISLSSQVGEVTGKKCFFLPSSTTFDTKVKNQKSKNHRKEIVLTFIGRMELIKGPDLLVDAILKLQGKISNFRINFIGDGSLLPRLEKRVEKGNVKRYVRFYGNLDDRSKIINVLSASDWIIIPSRSDSIPLVFSEAMKVGVPVIASDLPDLKYFIDKYKVGLNFKTEDSNELSRIIGNLTNYNKRMKEFKSNASKVAGMFTVKSSVDEFLKMISV